MPHTIPNHASDAGPEDHSASMDSRDYIDLAIEALELAKYATTERTVMHYLGQAQDYTTEAGIRKAEGK